LEFAARSLKQSGFRNIILLGDHGGYQQLEQAVAQQLNFEWKAANTRVYAIREYYLAATTDFASLLTARGLSREEIGTHAGVADTSLMLAIDPALVRPEQLRSGRKFERRDGVYGDPRRSTAELGRLGTELIVNRTVDAIRAAISKR
jgi:creatinine amidohydrolase/Fe(II)-dependent formamide hydrolase-like protein